MQTRREFLKSIGAVATSLVISGGVGIPAKDERRKPNLVFVFADQLRACSVGCYGDKQAITPNIDRMASEGVRFTNAISTWPVCSPYRAMMMTGMYPMSNGVVYNDFPIWDGLPYIGSTFKSHGYETGYIGKWHLQGKGEGGNVPEDRRLGFDYWMPVSGQILTEGPDGKQVWRPDVQTDKAIEYIRTHKDKPFCLFMSWNPPHDPYIAPDQYMNMFPPDKMELRPNTSEKELVRIELERHPIPASNQEAVRKRQEWRKRIDSDDGIRRNMQGYYAATHGLDVCMGRIMKALDEAGIADDTILVFTSDHGDMLGSHRMSHKQEPFEESICIPFILRYPRLVPRGKTTDALFSPMDVMPTILSLAGLPIPNGVQGVSCAEAALGRRHDQHEALLIMKMLPGGNPWIINAATEWRGVRTKTHTYARLADGGPWILYNNVDDPYQMRNLVNDPAYKALRDELEETMQTLLKEAGDPFDTEKIRREISEKSKTMLRREKVRARRNANT